MQRKLKMITWKDILINLLLFLSLFLVISGLIDSKIVQGNMLLGLPCIIIPAAFYYFVHERIKGRKRVGELLRQSFTSENYVILAERPLTFRERLENVEFDFGPFINGVSINTIKYKSRMKRHFLVRNEKGHDFELIVSIIQTWTDKIKYSVDSKSRIRN